MEQPPVIAAVTPVGSKVTEPPRGTSCLTFTLLWVNTPPVKLSSCLAASSEMLMVQDVPSDMLSFAVKQLTRSTLSPSPDMVNVEFTAEDMVFPSGSFP
jgi:hypothetical protein